MVVVISAQVSIYPLRQARLEPVIDTVLAVLTSHGLEVTPGAMSTLASGEADAIFAALRDAFVRVSDTGDAVMVVTLSNACPT